MATPGIVRALVRTFGQVSSEVTRTQALPIASKTGKIFTTLQNVEGETPYHTFNRRFDILYGDDCRDPSGRLTYLECGKFGLGAVYQYLVDLDFYEESFRPMLELVMLKLQRVIEAMRDIM